MRFATVVALAFGTLAAAAPTLSPRNTDTYATFYNDDACTQGAGEAVDTTNPGCLNESGRRSIYFQAAFDNSDKLLIESADQNCPCQTHCDLIPINTHGGSAFCYPIDLTAYNSLRFIAAANNPYCPANNC